jgi:hypothetical protein
LQATGDALPFADDSFGTVCEFATVHHVPSSIAVVRVARKMIEIVVRNRFGQGWLPTRVFKRSLYRFGLWGTFNFLRTREKRYQISEGDGLFYSYSVYVYCAVIADWADRILVVAKGPCNSRSWLHPLLTAAGVIVAAFRGKKSSGSPAYS